MQQVTTLTPNVVSEVVTIMALRSPTVVRTTTPVMVNIVSRMLVGSLTCRTRCRAN